MLVDAKRQRAREKATFVPLFWSTGRVTRRVLQCMKQSCNAAPHSFTKSNKKQALYDQWSNSELFDSISERISRSSISCVKLSPVTMTMNRHYARSKIQNCLNFFKYNLILYVHSTSGTCIQNSSYLATGSGQEMTHSTWLISTRARALSDAKRIGLSTEEEDEKRSTHEL